MQAKKISETLKGDFLKQIDGLLKVNKNLKLFLLSQTKIDDWIVYQLKLRKVEIIKAKIDKAGLKKRLDEMKLKYIINMSEVKCRRAGQNISDTAINAKAEKILKSDTKSVKIKNLRYIYDSFAQILREMGSDKGKVHCYLDGQIEGTTMAREVQKNIEEYIYNFYLVDILCLNMVKNIDIICFKNMSGRPNLYVSTKFEQHKFLFTRRSAHSNNERAFIKNGNYIFYPVLNGNLDGKII